MKHRNRLLNLFGEIDIYLFDQILKGRLDACSTLLDAGCGQGRNLVFFLQSGVDVFGVDRDPIAIKRLQDMALELAPQLSPDNFQVADLRQIPHDDLCFDLVICNAVLHFAPDETQFRQMLDEVWRVLKVDGLLFCRLASSIGLQAPLQKISGRRYELPDGSERFLVDEAFLLLETARLGGRLTDPVKTSNVQNLRCMTTWCLTKQP